MTLLLVEDTQRLADALVTGLRGEAFTVEHCARGHAAMERLGGAPIDALILDLGLPDCDGLEVLARMRRLGSRAPVLVLTARDAVASRVAALQAGADDDLVKPFAFEELVARLHALIRRSRAPRWAPLSCGDLERLPDQPGVRLVHVAHLRKKLRGSAARIRTIRGVGLMLTTAPGEERGSA